MKFMKKLSVAGFLAAMLVMGGCFFGGQAKTVAAGPTVSFSLAGGKNYYFSVELAETVAERKQGLMNRKSLGKYEGMLFIFDKDDMRNFWMKNTLIPLDMIFMDKDYHVVHVTKQAQPCKKDPCDVLGSGKPAKFVLEVNGGMADEMGLKEGDTAQVTL